MTQLLSIQDDIIDHFEFSNMSDFTALIAVTSTITYGQVGVKRMTNFCIGPR